MKSKPLGLLTVMILGVFFGAAGTARAQTETTLHSFAGATGDGAEPGFGSLIMDGLGNLYGTTQAGGNGTGTDCESVTGPLSGCGTVFELSPNGTGGYTEKILYNFGGTPDGDNPHEGLLMDKSGNLYGTTWADGPAASCTSSGDGTVFELSANGSGGYTERILYTFRTDAPDVCSATGTFVDGGGPNATLIMDSAGNLYGTTTGGGTCSAGTVFELVNNGGNWTENQLWQFGGTSCSGGDGDGPFGALAMDANGDLFGTTSGGGNNNQGSVFELVKGSTGYTEQILYSFTGTGGDGYDPNAGVILDAAGNLYGTTMGTGGGTGGSVFELVKSGSSYTENVLYNFTCGNDGCSPAAPLIMDGAGNLYGTTTSGGPNGIGTVFEMVKSSGGYTEKVLYSFPGSASDGVNPIAGVLMDPAGDLYGTTGGNGGATAPGMGTVFELVSGNPGALFAPSSLAFTSSAVGTSSATQNVTVTSIGGANLTFGSGAVTLTGANAADFSLASDGCSGKSISAGGTCVVGVSFKPSVAGAESATLNFADNAANSPQTVGLSGTVAVQGASLSSTSLNFSSQAVGTSSVAQTLTLTNTGTDSVTSLSIAASGDFNESNNCGSSLPGGANCAISVKFAPSVAGSRSGTLTVAGTFTSGSSVAGTLNLSVSLFGYGTTSFVPPMVGLRFVPVTPCRVADTRNANGPFGGPSLAGGTSRDFAIPSSACGIPLTAMAYSLNVAVVPGGPLGYLTVWPTGEPQPLVATLNSVDGRVKSNAAIVPAGVGGAISVYGSNGTAVVLDINGYFVPVTNPTALAFYPLTPCRVVDTRNANGPLGGPYLTGGQSRTFPMQSSSCGIPATAQAYSLNFAAVPHVPLGYLTAWPTGQAQPFVATLNAVTGTVTANAAIVPVGASGSINVYASNDTDLVIDINGYFAPAASGGMSLYVLTPCRALDTRQPAGSAPFSGTINVDVVGSSCGVSAGAQAFVFNATVVPPGALGYLTMWPQGTTQPVVATLNAVDGAVTNNMAIVPTTNGSISAFASNPTYLILDIFGYFGP